MTALNRADIPASVDTVEKLLVWAALVLGYLNETVTAVEGTNSANAVTVKTCTAAPFFVPAEINASPQWRFVTRNSFQLSSNWQKGQTKIWTHIQEFSSASIPTEFKS
ncbi:hypothetical protein SAMD00079811_82480 (plasmid) [Scytonema sp. HK-05]|uniref:hypothetical protein n=1 Tax=Scytonema sp. HK-05 TaxID=1137095 RepID=UPI0009366980|nr:hypothetical protein [Scytonema sp. HK-05]OKH48893.1 hypothetical protein NIES2130_35170 [Scytonema sp. HK-05]BAY50619.1 hypothetical protein SAMD00079811_82480 [Scytonema sp. HK-05]